jgi:uncharacterized protein YyaL (SSP411 family)
MIELAFHMGLSKGDKKWSEMATLTLDNMQAGGIYDEVDGGFFRYATRGDWDNPHYEKLLETNARMLSVYLKVYRAGRRDIWQQRNSRLLFLVLYMMGVRAAMLGIRPPHRLGGARELGATYS